MREWLRGWYETLLIMIFERDLYRMLKSDGDGIDESDFVEVGPPE